MGSHLQNTSSNAIIITPAFCVLGTAGSGESTSCTYTVSMSENTAAGTYTVTPSVLVNDEIIQTLSPITVLVSATSAPSSKSIISYSLNGTDGVITGQNIAVTMPYGTDVSSLRATYITTGATVSVGSTVQDNGVTQNNFTNPVVYTVMAADGTTQDYMVTVSVAANSAKSITSFALNGISGVITGQNIAVMMPYGTDISSLIATYITTGTTVSVGSIVQENEVTQNNFTIPMVYTVHAADGTTQDYTVTVSLAASTAKSITSFALNGIVGIITGQNIVVRMPSGTDVTALIASFNISGDSVTVSGVSQVNTVTANDFTAPVMYTVHAADGSIQNYNVSVIVPIASKIISAAYSVCSIGSNGLAYCWGRNNYGQLGNGTTTNSSVPVAITLPSGVMSFMQLWTGNGYIDGASCAIGDNGLAYCWGRNNYGQLGNGTTTDSSVPVAVTLPSGVTSFAYISTAGRVSCGLGNNGLAYCWGDNYYGQLGNGTTTRSSVPVAVTLPSGVTSFTSIGENSYFTCGIGDNGRAYCWGKNEYGQLGNGTTTNSLVPVAVTLPSGVTSFPQISVSQDDAAGTVCAIGDDGLAYCWGKNEYGQLGNGTTTNSSVPVAVTLPSGVTSFIRISSGGAMTCAIGNNGLAYCWGYNNFGQLGNGTTTNSSVPVLVNLPSGVTSFTSITAGGTDDDDSYTSCGIGNNGLAYCWGRNSYGQLGNGTTTNSSVPVAVVGM